MTHLMYGPLAEWWPLLSPVDEYTDEAAIYADLLAEDGGEGATVLELGSGGGHVARHLTDRFALTLCDLSPDMLRMSRALHPDLEHIEGDMRTLRLGRTFDRVFIHDAIMYMTTEADLRAALATAYAHLRPGGRAVFVPDMLADSHRAWTFHGGSDAPDGRAMRYMEWTRPRDPGATAVEVIYTYTLRHADGRIETMHDIHHNGLFDRTTWLALLADVGFDAECREVPVVDEDLGIESLEVFIGRRPAA